MTHTHEGPDDLSSIVECLHAIEIILLVAVILFSLEFLWKISKKCNGKKNQKNPHTELVQEV